ncbi:hypothetical protein TNCV_4834591 [Trichonephila clavipes]|nr:hypothetical protein TNCV_4834591 [Trichonephila clavipes]
MTCNTKSLLFGCIRHYHTTIGPSSPREVDLEVGGWHGNCAGWLKGSSKLLESFGNGPRNFEPWSSDGISELVPPSPNFHTTLTRGHLSPDIFSVHRPPLHGGSSAISGSNP